MHRPTIASFTLLLLLLTSLVTADLAQVKAQSTGTQAGMFNGVLVHEITSQQAQTLANSGINWVSCDVTFNPSDDCKWFQVYSLAKQYNLSVLGVLDWHLMNYSQTFEFSDWNNAVNQAVNSFGDVVKTWEVWNEPSFSWNNFGFCDGTPQQYVALMQATYNDIKTLAPNDMVIGLGGVPLFTGAEPISSNTYAQQALTWVQNVVQLGGMNYCDAIAIHAYPYGAYSVISQVAFQIWLQDYQQMCPGKLIWATEVGQESFSTNWTATQAAQSSFLTQSYSLLQSFGVKAYIWYELNDNNADRPNSNFGLFDIYGNPKQAFESYANLASGSTSSATPTSTALATASPTGSPTLAPAMPEFPSFIITITALIAASTAILFVTRKSKR
jgi:hypothetical protein